MGVPPNGWIGWFTRENPIEVDDNLWKHPNASPVVPLGAARPASWLKPSASLQSIASTCARSAPGKLSTSEFHEYCCAVPCDCNIHIYIYTCIHIYVYIYIYMYTYIYICFPVLHPLKI